MLSLDNVDVRCGDGWLGILRKMMDEINRADLKVHGLVAGERMGHLSIEYADAEPWLATAKVFLLAEFRSYYVCEVCGRPGEHRGDGPVWRTTRCAEHQSETPGRLIYDRSRTPWRRMSDGDWSYDVDGDTLKPRP